MCLFKKKRKERFIVLMVRKVQNLYRVIDSIEVKDKNIDKIVYKGKSYPFDWDGATYQDDLTIYYFIDLSLDSRGCQLFFNTPKNFKEIVALYDDTMNKGIIGDLADTLVEKKTKSLVVLFIIVAIVFGLMGGLIGYIVRGGM